MNEFLDRREQEEAISKLKTTRSYMLQTSDSPPEADPKIRFWDSRVEENNREAKTTSKRSDFEAGLLLKQGFHLILARKRSE